MVNTAEIRRGKERRKKEERMKKKQQGKNILTNCVTLSPGFREFQNNMFGFEFNPLRAVRTLPISPVMDIFYAFYKTKYDVPLNRKCGHRCLSR